MLILDTTFHFDADPDPDPDPDPTSSFTHVEKSEFIFTFKKAMPVFIVLSFPSSA
jgi:hypothetical protein